MKKTAHLLIIVGVILFFSVVSWENYTQQRAYNLDLMEKNGLSDARKKQELSKIFNPRQKIICLQKSNNAPVTWIEVDGTIKNTKVEICGSGETKEVLTSGSEILIDEKNYVLNHLFIQKIEEDMPDYKMKKGDNFCVAVEKIYNLPEYKTKGPWFLIPYCQPAN